MNTHTYLGAVVAINACLLHLPAAEAVDRRVEFRECPKCDKRIRIDLAANKAYVNLSRLEGVDKDGVGGGLYGHDAADCYPSRRRRMMMLLLTGANAR